jgi:hypothetical protein
VRNERQLELVDVEKRDVIARDKWLTWTFVPATVTRMSAAAIAV